MEIVPGLVLVRLFALLRDETDARAAFLATDLRTFLVVAAIADFFAMFYLLEILTHRMVFTTGSPLF